VCGQLESAYAHRHRINDFLFIYDFVVSKFQAYNHCDANYLRLVALDKCVLATLSVSCLCPWSSVRRARSGEPTIVATRETKVAATLWVADFSAIFPTEFETIDL